MEEERMEKAKQALIEEEKLKLLKQKEAHDLEIEKKKKEASAILAKIEEETLSKKKIDDTIESLLRQ